MRMWMIHPRLLCRFHLLGEHRTVHGLPGLLSNYVSMKGYVNQHIIEIQNVYSRHEVLIRELHWRGYKHKSPMKPDVISAEDTMIWQCNVDTVESVLTLHSRCEECARLFVDYGITVDTERRTYQWVL